MIAFETLPCLKEAQAIAHLLRTELPGRPAWLTFNCRDEARLSNGEDFAKEAVPLAFEASHQSLAACLQCRRWGGSVLAKEAMPLAFEASHQSLAACLQCRHWGGSVLVKEAVPWRLRRATRLLQLLRIIDSGMHFAQVTQTAWSQTSGVAKAGGWQGRPAPFGCSACMIGARLAPIQGNM